MSCECLTFDTFLYLLMQVDANNIYGDNLMRQFQLRLHKEGKLKYQVIMKYFGKCAYSLRVRSHLFCTNMYNHSWLA